MSRSPQPFATILVCLCALTAVEVWLAYRQVFSTEAMLFILIALSAFKALLILLYFMHLKYERLDFVLSVLPPVVFMICVLGGILPDAVRLLNYRAH